MWDTAGQERFKALIPSYLKNAHSIILTFDITAKSTFNSLSKWLQEIKDHVQDNVFGGIISLTISNLPELKLLVVEDWSFSQAITVTLSSIL